MSLLRVGVRMRAHHFLPPASKQVLLRICISAALMSKDGLDSVFVVCLCVSEVRGEGDRATGDRDQCGCEKASTAQVGTRGQKC